MTILAKHVGDTVNPYQRRTLIMSTVAIVFLTFSRSGFAQDCKEELVQCRRDAQTAFHECHGNTCKVQLDKAITNCVSQFMCTRGKVCRNGVCLASEGTPQTVGQVGCQTGLSACGSACVNLKSDAQNCGVCGTVCQNGTSCSNGACVVALDHDIDCPTIPDQPTNMCPRLKNFTLNCGGNGKVHWGIGGGGASGPPVIGLKLDDQSKLSAVVVVVNCQDGPREGITFGVTYTGLVATPPTASPCISKSKVVFSQFQFTGQLGVVDTLLDPRGVAQILVKDKLHQTFDDQAIMHFTSSFGITPPAVSRCNLWRELP